MNTYITKCVSRYKDHPALGQWILWNDPTKDGIILLWSEEKFNKAN